jgi:hypothetical protein
LTNNLAAIQHSSSSNLLIVAITHLFQPIKPTKQIEPTDMVEYLSTEKLIHTQEKWVDDFHRAFG